jgi:hypothetical protein
MLLLERLEGMVAPDLAIEPKADAALAELLDALGDDVLLQLEARNAIGQQPAGAVVRS